MLIGLLAVMLLSITVLLGTAKYYAEPMEKLLPALTTPTPPTAPEPPQK